MMRVVAMKNRQCEYGAMKTLLHDGLISNEIVPLVEIVKEGGSYDIAKWSELFSGRMLFADFFRCDLKEYGKVDMEKIKLVIKLTNNLDRYQEKVQELTHYPNIIPVITIKRNIDKLSAHSVVTLIADLRAARHSGAIAVRIDDIKGYEQVLKAALNDNDFVIFDISEQPYAAKVMEYDELHDLGLKAHTVLLCSPRSRDTRNGSYEDGDYTLLIDNGGSVKYSDYGFDAYGDYGGLKDNLPGAGGNGQGCALALMYNRRLNQYKAYVCGDSSIGTKGFDHVASSILADRKELDPTKTCAAMSLIVEKYTTGGSNGNWATWIKYILMRTVQQLSA